ncbi:MAG: hypothetical protein O2983_09775 [Planctomycetota bacterium]|nr:hypothetical protein [Planctomycetota bacterium]MDA1159887.1 hypothetical protein [Planctomycetota bacterium]
MQFKWSNGMAQCKMLHPTGQWFRERVAVVVWNGKRAFAGGLNETDEYSDNCLFIVTGVWDTNDTANTICSDGNNVTIVSNQHAIEIDDSFALRCFVTKKEPVDLNFVVSG